VNAPSNQPAIELDPRWAAAREILAVRLDGVGDVLMTTPALRAVRLGNPDARLTLLTSSAGGAAGRLLPFVDRVLSYDPPWMKPGAGDRAADAAADREAIERLRDERFDAAIVFTVHTQSALPAALACHLAGIPLRLGHVRENPYRLLTDWVPDPESDEPIRHEVERQLALVAAVGYRPDSQYLSLRVPAVATRRVQRLLSERDIEGRRWLVVHPGASAPSRRWPPDAFASVVRQLSRDHGWHVVLTGDAAEAPLTAQVAAQVGVQVTDLGGVLDLGELAALLARAPLVVTNNTGPSHVAAAVGTPVVVLYALTNRQHAPWGVPSRVLFHDVPCRWCRKSVCPMGHHACLRRVEPAQVVTAVAEVIEEWESWRGVLDPFRPAGLVGRRRVEIVPPLHAAV
jgi:lipopolysaccharide heptosyltransferase II